MYSSSFPNYSTSTRPHRVSRLTFLIYSLDLLHKVTYIFWALTCKVALPSYTALVSSFYTSSHDFDTHFLHFHLTMDSLCFSMWLAISTSTTDFHRLAKQHACRTFKKITDYYKVCHFSTFFCLNYSIFLNIIILNPILGSVSNAGLLDKFLDSIFIVVTR